MFVFMGFLKLSVLSLALMEKTGVNHLDTMLLCYDSFRYNLINYCFNN